MPVVFTTPKRMVLATEDVHNVVVLEAIDLARDDGARFRVPVGATSDLVTTPRVLWIKYPPFGVYARSGIVHDAAYRGTLLRETTEGLYLPAMLPKDECDRLFLDCMICDQVDEITRDEFYEGVSKLGWRAFREDRSAIASSPP